jgi:hypothetical protein
VLECIFGESLTLRYDRSDGIANEANAIDGQHMIDERAHPSRANGKVLAGFNDVGAANHSHNAESVSCAV